MTLRAVAGFTGAEEEHIGFNMRVTQNILSGQGSAMKQRDQSIYAEADGLIGSRWVMRCRDEPALPTVNGKL